MAKKTMLGVKCLTCGNLIGFTVICPRCDRVIVGRDA